LRDISEQVVEGVDVPRAELESAELGRDRFGGVVVNDKTCDAANEDVLSGTAEERPRCISSKKRVGGGSSGNGCPGGRFREGQQREKSTGRAETEQGREGGEVRAESAAGVADRVQGARNGAHGPVEE